MVLDYAKGGDLGKILQREIRFDEDKTWFLFKLKYYIDNIVIDENGHALLTDFGLSKKGVIDCLGA